MKQTINKLTPTRIEIVETTEQRQEFEKATLEVMKQEHLIAVAKIDELLLQFTEASE